MIFKPQLININLTVCDNCYLDFYSNRLIRDNKISLFPFMKVIYLVRYYATSGARDVWLITVYDYRRYHIPRCTEESSLEKEKCEIK